MAEFKVEIEKKIGALQDKRNSKGMLLELNLVSFNDRRAKYDIRPWDEAHATMGKGVSLSKDEVIKLKELLNGLDLDKATTPTT